MSSRDQNDWLSWWSQITDRAREIEASKLFSVSDRLVEVAIRTIVVMEEQKGGGAATTATTEDNTFEALEKDFQEVQREKDYVL